MKTSEWIPGEKMSREFALGAIDEMKRFCSRLYYQPQMKPFNTDIDFEEKMQVLNGLKKFVETRVTE
jgi:hypothetical protein